MRFMVIVKATRESEAGVMPSRELLAAMGKFNEELVQAGVMLAGEGLQSSAKGARVRFSGSNRAVIDGPFPETKELIAGYWMWRCASLADTIDSIWTKWMPTSGLQASDAPCIERYTAAFDPVEGRGGIEIWIPVRVE